MLIRPATLADISLIMALAAQSPMAAQWPREHYEQAIQVPQPRRVLLVLEEKNTILAFLSARVVDREWELENIAVANEARCRGLGSQILNTFLEIARGEKAQAIFLEVRESNNPARAFYKKWGFEETGHRTDYYSRPAEAAIIYRLSIL